MPFRYRLEKILDFRRRKKEEQLQNVIKAQNEVIKVERKIEANNEEIASAKVNMRHADPMMYEAYDNFLNHLYEIDEKLHVELKEAQKKLDEEKEKLLELERAVKVLEKHKDKMKEAYLEEEKKAELKNLSEIAVQKHFQKMLVKIEEELTDEEKGLLN